MHFSIYTDILYELKRPVNCGSVDYEIGSRINVKRQNKKYTINFFAKERHTSAIRLDNVLILMSSFS